MFCVLVDAHLHLLRSVNVGVPAGWGSVFPDRDIARLLSLVHLEFERMGLNRVSAEATFKSVVQAATALCEQPPPVLRDLQLPCKFALGLTAWGFFFAFLNTPVCKT